VASDIQGIVSVGDSVRLRQVLINLTANAIKFSTNGVVRLVARVIALSPDRVCIRFSVEDQGIGIAADRREQIFRAFEQEEKSTHRRFGGTGLGLSISKELVEMMGGRLSVDSEVGKGSRFFFTLDLPRLPAMPVADETGEPVASALANGLRVLLCEDNAVNQRVATRMLETLGAHVTLAHNGREGLERFAEAEHDLILMDLIMPELDGVEAVREIRMLEAHLGRRTPIIALTASAFREDIDRCLAAGMDGYLSKPFVRSSLLAEISRVLQRDAAVPR
jgi:CheY-like chemotaxis protein